MRVSNDFLTNYIVFFREDEVTERWRLKRFEETDLLRKALCRVASLERFFLKPAGRADRGRRSIWPANGERHISCVRYGPRREEKTRSAGNLKKKRILVTGEKRTEPRQMRAGRRDEK